MKGCKPWFPALEALVGLDDITRALMSADHSDHQRFTSALDATNALRCYFEGVQALERLGAKGSQPGSGA